MTDHCRRLTSRFIAFTLSLFRFGFFLLIVHPFTHTSAHHQNITLLSSDGSFEYQPFQALWHTLNDSGATNGSYMIAREADAEVAITKRFRSVYYSAPVWPFPLQIMISIEPDNVQTVVDLQDTNLPWTSSPLDSEWPPSSSPSQVRFTFQGTKSETRTIRVSAANTGASGWVALIDSMIFDVGELRVIPPPGTVATTSSISTRPLPKATSTTPRAPTPTTAGSLPIPQIPVTPQGQTETKKTDPITPGTTILPAGLTVPPTSVPVSTQTPGSGSTSAPTGISVPDHTSGKKRTTLIALICALLALLIIGGVIVWYTRKRRNRMKGDLTEVYEPQGVENMYDSGDQGGREEKAVAVERLNCLSPFDNGHVWSSQVENALDTFTTPTDPTILSHPTDADEPPTRELFTLSRPPPPLEINGSTECNPSAIEVSQSLNPFIFGVIDAMGLNSRRSSRQIAKPATELPKRHTWSVSGFSAAPRDGLEEMGSDPRDDFDTSFLSTSPPFHSSAQLGPSSPPLTYASSQVFCYAAPDAARFSAPQLTQYTTSLTAWSRSSLASSLSRHDLLDLLEGTAGGVVCEQTKLQRMGSLNRGRSTSVGGPAPLTERFLNAPPLPPTSFAQNTTARLRTSSSPAKPDVLIESVIHTPISDRSSVANWNDVMTEFPVPPQVEGFYSKDELQHIPLDSVIDSGVEPALQPRLDDIPHLDSVMNKGDAGEGCVEGTRNADLLRQPEDPPLLQALPTTPLFTLPRACVTSKYPVPLPHVPSTSNLAVHSGTLPRPLPSININALPPPVRRRPRRLPVPVASHGVSDPSPCGGLRSNPCSSPNATNNASTHPFQPEYLTPPIPAPSLHGVNQHGNSHFSLDRSTSMGPVVTPPPQYSSRVTSLHSDTGSRHSRLSTAAGGTQEVLVRAHPVNRTLRLRAGDLTGGSGGIFEAPSYTSVNEPNVPDAVNPNRESAIGLMGTGMTNGTAMGEIQRLVIAEIERLHAVVDDFEPFLPPRMPARHEGRALPTPPP